MFLNIITSSTIGYINANFTAYLILYSIIMACEGPIYSCFPTESRKIFGNKVKYVIKIKNNTKNISYTININKR